ncbi:Nitrogen assimilation transcription factor nit-4-like protein 10 [Colletotrichum chlorophyti]|uniref:Nitrogen assimilation transcription factor nit-4-like protein 10 n=1 Tax=Colletotrichum chlorophyti TaxID=708187 RepID=A0A1Q8RH67_9PEZI|nr:Nitrogen assimilation transcription factor nit-4-like protein 10 [Colletotrichum chlorophyti]
MALKRENQSLRAMLSQLTAMPEDLAHETLKKLKFAVDPYAALRAIRPSGPKDARDILPHVHTNLEFELARRHPIAYPQARRFSQLDLMQSPGPRPAKVQRVMGVPRKEASTASERDGLTVDPTDTVREAAAPLDISAEHTQPTPKSGFYVPPMGPIPPPPPPTHRDPRLKELNIGFWTAVPISNEAAADVIALYLETDHAILGLFDADLFVDDLVNCQIRHCSPLLVSALLAFACQAYAAKQPEASRWSQELEAEASTLWLAERDDTLPNIIALAFLIQSCGCNGNGELDVRYIQEAVGMAKRMKLFGCADAYTFADLRRLSEEEARATTQAAWGVFNTLSMTAQFYLPATTAYPPTLPVPGHDQIVDSDSKTEPPQNSRESSASSSAEPAAMSSSRSRKRGRSLRTPETFAAFCSLMVISSQITWVYQHESSPGRSSQAFALAKYSKLLAWADNLSEGMERGEHSPAHVLVCHMWFHGTILYLLRPFIPADKQHGFSEWSPSAGQIPAFFAASVEQLKELVEVYSSYPPATYSIFWHSSLLNLANAVASDPTNPDWKHYFLSCIRGYQGLYSSFTVAEVIAGGLLSMVVRKGAMEMTEALTLLQELRAKKGRKPVGRATGMFVTDLDLAVTDREAARVDRVIEKFEEMTILDEFTQGII